MPLAQDYDQIILEIGSKGELTEAKALPAAGYIVIAHQAYPAARLMFAIGGYDEDKRELWEIPEAKRYINAVFGRVRTLVPNIADLNFDDLSLAMIGVCAGTMEVVEQDPVTGAYRIEIKEGTR